MAGKLGFTFLDVSGESSRVDVNVADVTADTLAPTLAQANVAGEGTLAAVIQALTLCALTAYEVIAKKDKPAYTPPSSM